MFDPVQDLLVLLEQQREIVGDDAHDPAPFLTTDKELAIHLHSLTSNTCHPGASSPVIRYRVTLTTERGWSTRANIIICDDIVGLLLGTDTPRLIVWKWKSGDMIVVRFDSQLELNLMPRLISFTVILLSSPIEL